MAFIIGLQQRQLLASLIILFSLLTFIVDVASHTIPRPSGKSSLSVSLSDIDYPEASTAKLTLRSSHPDGTCPPAKTWSRIIDDPKAGATCCDEGYQARSKADRTLTELGGIFCCPDTTPEEEYCQVQEQRLPVPPDSCPRGTYRNQARCVGGYLAEDSGMRTSCEVRLLRVVAFVLAVVLIAGWAW